MLPLRLRAFWATVGWAGVVAGLVLSLWPGGAPMPFHVWDKIQHATGYFVLATWFTGAYPRSRYPLIGVGCVLLGIAIEGLQALTPTRTAEVADAFANTVGVTAALILAYAGIGGWAARIERLLGLVPR